MQQRACIPTKDTKLIGIFEYVIGVFLLTIYCIDDNFELCHRLFSKTCIIKTFMYKYRFEPTIKT